MLLVVVTLLNYVLSSSELADASNPSSDPDAIQVVKLSHKISIVDDEFILDGKRLQIASGSMHYFRLPAEYWQDRLWKLRAAGLNSVSTYVEWSYHEPEERVYLFEGDRDIVRFIKLAAAEGLHVLLRPGPYICAERDLGGLPYWLLGKYPNIKLRTTDKDFIQETKIWMKTLFELITPLLYGNGGPIIMVQVENEYGSYDNDTEYKNLLFNIFKEHVGESALLFTTNGNGDPYIASGAIPSTVTTVGFKPLEERLDADAVFHSLRQVMPKGPLMNSELYSGWLTHWGERLQRVSTRTLISTLRTLLKNKINFNMYMFFGGTNFEFTAGANDYRSYRPIITSYDYDAPLTEAGDPTQKYFAIRDSLYKYGFEAKHLSAPEEMLKAAYGRWPAYKQYGLLTAKGRSTLGKKYSDKEGAFLPTFEMMRLRCGLMLYETVLSEDGQGVLQVKDPRDRVYVYIDNALRILDCSAESDSSKDLVLEAGTWHTTSTVNGFSDPDQLIQKFFGIISRKHTIHSLSIISKSNGTLSLLVENQGRIHYGNQIQIHDYKGIQSVLYNNVTLCGRWSITGFPLQDIPSAITDDQQEVNSGPVLYEGTFTLPIGLEPLDTYLDPTGWTKGYIWVNGHNLGRYWPGVGPQVTLYLPGVWLLAAPTINRLQILELENESPSQEIQSIGYPILNRNG